MRLLSRISHCCCQKAFDRAPGEYIKSEEDSAEPARTERLMASPFRLFHRNSGDAYDASSMFLLMRSTGSGFAGVFYDLICIATLLGLGVAYGLGDLAERTGTGAATAQAVMSRAGLRMDELKSVRLFLESRLPGRGGEIRPEGVVLGCQPHQP